MKTQNARSFMRRLDRDDIKYRIMESSSGKDRIRVSYRGDNKDRISLDFFFENDEETISVYCYDVAHCPSDKKLGALVAINMMNTKYKWVKFYLDDDNDVIAEVDLEVTLDSAAEVARRCCGLAVNIIDEAYPLLQYAIDR
ncbi:MAG: YbjN domain-containing protein [Butyricicoccaceae bacterium]